MVSARHDDDRMDLAHRLNYWRHLRHLGNACKCAWRFFSSSSPPLRSTFHQEEVKQYHADVAATAPNHPSTRNRNAALNSQRHMSNLRHVRGHLLSGVPPPNPLLGEEWPTEPKRLAPKPEAYLSQRQALPPAMSKEARPRGTDLLKMELRERQVYEAVQRRANAAMVNPPASTEWIMPGKPKRTPKPRPAAEPVPWSLTYNSPWKTSRQR